jgi:hypothetical protein
LFVAYRFFAGVAIGGSSMLALLHLTPIAPAHRRGAFVGLFQHSISWLEFCSRTTAIFFSSRFRRRADLAVFLREFAGGRVCAITPSAARLTGFRKRRSPATFRCSLRIRKPQHSHSRKMMLLQFIAAFIVVPETRGVALERSSCLPRGPRRDAARRNM